MSSGARERNAASSNIVEFPLSVIKIQKGDITKWSIDGVSDAIVNPTDPRMFADGGADKAIHIAAGNGLKEACLRVPKIETGVRCPIGEARITRGYKLPAEYVVHTVGPIYGVDSNPEVALKNTYRNSLRLAKEKSIQYIAFPAISCGQNRYPVDRAATVAISTVDVFGRAFKEVHFVVLTDEIYNAWVEKARQLVSNWPGLRWNQLVSNLGGEGIRNLSLLQSFTCFKDLLSRMFDVLTLQ